MKIKVIVVGNVKESYYRDMIENYKIMIKKRHDIQLIELKDESIPKNASASEEQKVRDAEGERILENIDASDFVYALCIDGTMQTSDQFIKHVSQKAENVNGALTFVIGGSIGLANFVVSRANYKLSFSHMTFPHQLMRVMLLEQLAKL